LIQPNLFQPASIGDAGSSKQLNASMLLHGWWLMAGDEWAILPGRFGRQSNLPGPAHSA